MAWDDTIYEDEHGILWCSVCGCLVHNCECEMCKNCGIQKHVMETCNCKSSERKIGVWIVGIDPGYYPSIEEFSDESKAREAYEEALKNRLNTRVWLAKVEESNT